MHSTTALTVSVLGIGAIGSRVATGLDRGEVPGLRLAAVSAGCLGRAERFAATLRSAPSALPVEEAITASDVVVECLPPGMLADVAELALQQGKRLLACSVGALMLNPGLLDSAGEKGGTIYAPSGALAGLDGVRAAARCGIRRASLVTEKPVSGFGQSDYLDSAGIRLDQITTAIPLFQGDVRECIRHFPKNVNVAGALCLAGVEPERLRMELWANPKRTSNCHTVAIESAAGNMRFTVENAPDPENPKTSLLTAYSVLATLDRIVARFVI